MTDGEQVNTTLRSKYNSCKSHSDEKGYVLDIFYMWHVWSGIVNLLSLLTLEHDGYMYQYCTYSAWIVGCPDGTILNFKHDKGLCKGFPCIDIENLSTHVFKRSNIAEDPLEDSKTKGRILKDLETNMEALKEILKAKDISFHQTVRQSMEGFVNHEIKGLG